MKLQNTSPTKSKGDLKGRTRIDNKGKAEHAFPSFIVRESLDCYPSYSYFVSCCKRYLRHKDRLQKQNHDPTSLIEKRSMEIIKQEVKIVEETFSRIRLCDEKLAVIMYLKLVEGKSLRQIDTDSRAVMSKRSIIQKYPEKKWKKLYEEILAAAV